MRPNVCWGSGMSSLVRTLGLRNNGLGAELRSVFGLWFEYACPEITVVADQEYRNTQACGAHDYRECNGGAVL